MSSSTAAFPLDAPLTPAQAAAAKHGLTLGEVSRRGQLDRAQVTRLLSGQYIPQGFRTARQLADGLGITLDELYDLLEDQQRAREQEGEVVA